MFNNGFTTGALALLAGSQLAAAHMEISYPAPFRSKFNPNAVNVDYTNTAPLSDSGSNYPCKGYHSDFGTAAGAPTAEFAPGGSYNFTVVGGAPHGGGSCQVSLSYDQGKTFTVIQSIIGGCPLASNYPFTIPSDAPTGEAIWAWTWNNNIGNREQYMNCAAVTIGGGSKREVKTRASAPFSSRPQVFVANIGNGCKTNEGSDVEYPDPGPDVVNNGGQVGPPVGSCGSTGGGAGAGAGAGSGSGSGEGNQGGDAPSSTTAVQATAAPAPTPSNPPSLPGGVFITPPAAQPTTLVTQTAVAPPAATGGAGSGSGSGSDSGSGEGSGSGSGNTAGGHAQGTACTEEGAWNCIGGTSFQRCASGAWSAPQAVSAGTVCKVGEAGTLSIEAAASKKLRVRRFRGASRARLA